MEQRAFHMVMDDSSEMTEHNPATLTIHLYSQVNLCFTRVRGAVSAELDVGADSVSDNIFVHLQPTLS